MAASTAHPPQILHLSLVVGGALRDADGERLGRVDDLIVRLGGAGYPPITGLPGRRSPGAVLPRPPSRCRDDRHRRRGDLRKAKLDLRRFERRPEEVLLKRRRARPPADQRRGRAAGARQRDRAGAASRAGGAWWASTPARAAACAGCCRSGSAARIATGEFLDWAERRAVRRRTCPTVRLRVPHPKLAKLHPAQIADLVEAASHSEGEEIIQAVGDDDRELEADVFEELDDQHQLRVPRAALRRSRSRRSSRAWRPTTPPTWSPSSTRSAARRCSTLLPVGQRVKVRALLGYDPAEAGGLMSPDFVAVYRQATVGEALERGAPQRARRRAADDASS